MPNQTLIEWANAQAARVEAAQAEGLTIEQARAEVHGRPASGATVATSGLDQITLAAQSLVNEFGISELEARQSIGTEPHQVPIEAHAERIAAEEARVVAIMQADADAAHAASPEGIEAAAAQRQVARQLKAQRVRLASDDLIESGQLSADDVAALSADEILEASGFVQTPDPFYAGANSYAVNKAAAEKGVS